MPDETNQRKIRNTTTHPVAESAQPPPRTLEAEPEPQTKTPASFQEYIQSSGGPSNFDIKEETRSDVPRVFRYTWIPQEEGVGAVGDEKVDDFLRGVGVDVGGTGSTDSKGEWQWVYDPVATSLWYEAGQPDLFSLAEPEPEPTGAGAGRSYVQSSPPADSKAAQKAYDDFMKRAKGVYDLQDQEFDWVQQGNRYNMDMAKNWREVGGFGAGDLYVGSPPKDNLSNQFTPYVDEGIADPDYLQLSRYTDNFPVRGYAMGTRTAPQRQIPEKLRPLMGRYSVYVGPPTVPGIPTGTIEGQPL